MYRNSWKRAKAKGWKFDLTHLYLEQMWRKNCGACALTGLYFSEVRIYGAHKRPFIPSLDRKDNRKGYIKGNVRIVCFAVNAALSTWGDAVFSIVALARDHQMRYPRKDKSWIRLMEDEE